MLDKNHYFKLCTSMLINASLTESNQSRQLRVWLLGYWSKRVVCCYQTPPRKLRGPFFSVYTLPRASCYMVIKHGTCDGYTIKVFWSTWLIDYLDERPFRPKDYRHKGVWDYMHYKSWGAFVIPRSWIEVRMESVFFFNSYIHIRYAGEWQWWTDDCTVFVSILCFSIVFIYLNYFHLLSFQLYDPLNHLMKGLYLQAMLLRWTLSSFPSWSYSLLELIELRVVTSSPVVFKTGSMCACWASHQEVNPFLLNLG